MRTWTVALILALGAASWACGGPSEPAGTTSGDSAPASSEETAASSKASVLVDRAVVEGCAGFNVAKAAELLGVPEAELQVSESWVERLGGQQCEYRSKSSRIGPSIIILLTVQESSAAARRILANQRELVPVVDVVPERGPALLEFKGIGDEAFWDTNTGGVNVRVRNVIGTVHAQLTNKPTSDRDQAQIEMERRVAEEIARGLSS